MNEFAIRDLKVGLWHYEGDGLTSELPEARSLPSLALFRLTDTSRGQHQCTVYVGRVTPLNTSCKRFESGVEAELGYLLWRLDPCLTHNA